MNRPFRSPNDCEHDEPELEELYQLRLQLTELLQRESDVRAGLASVAERFDQYIQGHGGEWPPALATYAPMSTMEFASEMLEDVRARIARLRRHIDQQMHPAHGGAL
jgi:hypothetical protein